MSVSEVWFFIKTRLGNPPPHSPGRRQEHTCHKNTCTNSIRFQAVWAHWTQPAGCPFPSTVREISKGRHNKNTRICTQFIASLYHLAPSHNPNPALKHRHIQPQRLKQGTATRDARIMSPLAVIGYICSSDFSLGVATVPQKVVRIQAAFELSNNQQ